ncbi:MAG: hypothetical protein HYX21_00335 [Candidatus Yanofskybacteria bacterium]|nr:hypothetical protein [Candidatus Yanofskybacteria bacterium]
MSLQTSKDAELEFEKELMVALQEVMALTQKSLSAITNNTKPELQKYAQETIGVLSKAAQLIQKLLEKLNETEKKLKTANVELAAVVARKPRHTTRD